MSSLLAPVRVTVVSFYILRPDLKTLNEWDQILTVRYDYPLVFNHKAPEPLLEPADIVATASTVNMRVHQIQIAMLFFVKCSQNNSPRDVAS